MANAKLIHVLPVTVTGSLILVLALFLVSASASPIPPGAENSPSPFTPSFASQPPSLDQWPKNGFTPATTAKELEQEARRQEYLQKHIENLHLGQVAKAGWEETDDTDTGTARTTSTLDIGGIVIACVFLLVIGTIVVMTVRNAVKIRKTRRELRETRAELAIANAAMKSATPPLPFTPEFSRGVESAKIRGD